MVQKYVFDKCRAQALNYVAKTGLLNEWVIVLAVIAYCPFALDCSTKATYRRNAG